MFDNISVCRQSKNVPISRRSRCVESTEAVKMIVVLLHTRNPEISHTKTYMQGRRRERQQGIERGGKVEKGERYNRGAQKASESRVRRTLQWRQDASDENTENQVRTEWDERPFNASDENREPSENRVMKTLQWRQDASESALGLTASLQPVFMKRNTPADVTTTGSNKTADLHSVCCVDLSPLPPSLQPVHEEHQEM